MKKITKVLFCLAIWATLVGSINAQNTAKNWVFGQNARINFNGGLRVASSEVSINTREGSALISDSNGNLLFYTDGITVWNSENNQMPNGFGLTGHDSSTQSALIVPCSCKRYFIFTTGVFDNYSNGFRYSIVDMSLNGGLGDVEVALKNTVLIQRASEKVAAVSDRKGGFWVVAHNMGNNQFLSYHIPADGNCTLNPQSAVPSGVGTSYGKNSGSNSRYGIGQMKLSPDGKRLAVAGNNYIGAASFVELFQFDINTGTVSNLASPTVRDTSTDGFYGIEFSPDSKSLYAATRFINNFIYRYDISDDTLKNRTPIYHVVSKSFRLAALQLAPDGRIYVARDESPVLNVLNSPNDANGGWTTPPTEFSLASGSLSQLGLPTMIAGEFLSWQPDCGDRVDLSSRFFPTPVPGSARGFTVYNVKFPSSDICSIDIDIRDANGNQPQNLWMGYGLYVNGVPLSSQFYPFTRIPGGTNTVIAGHTNFTSPAVRFNLGGLPIGYTGNVKLIIRHCDGTTDEWISNGWNP